MCTKIQFGSFAILSISLLMIRAGSATEVSRVVRLLFYDTVVEEECSEHARIFTEGVW